MSLAKASTFTAASTLVKILIGLIIGKLMALEFGPQGVGLSGNYRQVITVLGVLAGAGIFNGVTKYIAQFDAEQDKHAVKQLLGTASTLVLVFSLIICSVFLSFASHISYLLFATQEYANIIRIIAVLQFTIAGSNLILAILKGYRDAKGTAISIIIGALIALIGFICLQLAFGFSGALVGLGLLPAATFLPAIVFLQRRKVITLAMFLPAWHRETAINLSKFTLMTLMTAVTMPVAYYLLREQISQFYGFKSNLDVIASTRQSNIALHTEQIVNLIQQTFIKDKAMYQVGLWQSVSMISDAYLQFITAAFSVYLLPTFSRIKDSQILAKEVVKGLKFALPAVILLSSLVWLMRDVVIWLLFSNEFSQMRTLFSWQLTGDVLKVGCYVFGYLIIAKANLKLYFLAEVSQFSLLIFFSFLLIPKQGTLGASQAYMMTYMIYFILCLIGFIIFKYRSKSSLS
ncbi:lipid III flippase WzxE [Thorsellia anophelis]|uniref:Antigen flippase n=1 Tax=Thorsellia anophelis DSM 18579 TaxID=1123402 RepID=A0A1H9ZG23_9GAMM|nr:lipid III flippase WzxE [Thorsellia anophelis]SES80597.1 antigen flippase [Thorsellia anophelis DSM 18579]